MEVRIDKYLWAVRVFKTRSQAADACKKGRVTIDGVDVKPSRIVKPGEEVNVKRPPIVRTYKVLMTLQNRVSAKLAPDYVEDITSQEELLKLDQDKFGSFYYRERGAGRPTKKERRIIDSFTTDLDWEDEE